MIVQASHRSQRQFWRPGQGLLVSFAGQKSLSVFGRRNEGLFSEKTQVILGGLENPTAISVTMHNISWVTVSHHLTFSASSDKSTHVGRYLAARRFVLYSRCGLPKVSM